VDERWIKESADPCCSAGSMLFGLVFAYDNQAVPEHSSGDSEQKGLLPVGSIDKAISI